MDATQRPLAALAVIAVVALISACGSSAPAGSAGSAGSAGNNTPSTSEKAVKFARCMRSNGVSNFPDPSGSGRVTVDAIANGSSVDTSAPAFTHAVNACKALEPAGFMGSKRSSQQQQAGLRFAQCIRANGVPDFPDPTPNSPLVDTNRIPSSNSPGGMSALHLAMQKCSGEAAAAGVTR